MDMVGTLRLISPIDGGGLVVALLPALDTEVAEVDLVGLAE